MLVSELPIRTIKTTDYFIIETEGEATYRCHFDATELGLATTEKVTQLETKITETKEELKQEIQKDVSSVYVVKGSTSFAELPTVAEATVGWVYNITDDFTTTEDFVEGASKSYPAGTNVVCAAYGDGGNKWDILGNSKVDLSAYATKEEVKTGTTDKDKEQDTKLAQLQTAVETAQAAADAAKSAAQTAQEAAEAAQSTADGAQSAAEAAQTAAEKAQTTATAAQTALNAFKTEVKKNYIEVKAVEE